MPLIKLNATLGLTGTLPAVSGANLTNIDAGKVLQVVQANKSDMASVNNTSYSDISGLSVNITPTSSSNKVLVTFTANMSTQNHDSLVKLVRDSTDIVGSGATHNITAYPRTANGDTMTPLNTTYLDSPNTTSQITYKLQWRTFGDNLYINRRMGDTSFGTISNITVMEIST